MSILPVSGALLPARKLVGGSIGSRGVDHQVGCGHPAHACPPPGKTSSFPVLCSTRHKEMRAYFVRRTKVAPMTKRMPAIRALERLHADLAAQLITNRKETVRLLTGVRHVEAVLKLLEPGFKIHLIVPRRRNQKNPWFKKGEIFRNAIDVLRRAARPMTAREITEALLQSRGIEPDIKSVRCVDAGVRVSLRNHDGVTVERVGHHMPARWVLKGDAGPA